MNANNRTMTFKTHTVWIDFSNKNCWFESFVEIVNNIENWSLLLLLIFEFSYSLEGYKINNSYSRNVQRPTSNTNTYNNIQLTEY